MIKLAQPTWYYVLEAAKTFNGKSFTAEKIVKRVKKLAPRAKKGTIIVNLYGMTPNHPLSKNYPSLKKHAAFNYIGKGQFEVISMVNQRLDVL